MKIINSDIKKRLLQIRDELVILDSDIAILYEVETRDINKAVANNPDKFPNGYIIELSKLEFEALRCNFSTTKLSKRRSLPKCFTEKGLYMLATILKSKIATQTTIQIIETFTKMREFSSNHKDIIIKLQKMEQSLTSNQEQTVENTKHIKTAFELLSQILEDTTNKNKKLIGFARD